MDFEESKLILLNKEYGIDDKIILEDYEIPENRINENFQGFYYNSIPIYF